MRFALRLAPIMLVLGMAANPGAACAGDRRPNILLIVADDMGYADLGITGNRQIGTPHLDALARAGVFCRHAYVSAPYCSPTRAGLLTGRHGCRFGHEFNPRPGTWSIPSAGLPTTETLFVERLRRAGYRTGLVGKWHLGEAADQHPLARGFDEFFGFLGGETHYLPHEGKPSDLLRGRQRVTEGAYLTDALAREAAEYIERNSGHPWFLYLAFNAVHFPMEATERDLARAPRLEDRRRQTYLAMLQAMDDAVGAVMARLRRTGQDENTLIFFLSDNGGPIAPINPNVNGSVNLPLRGGKRQLLEGGVRVPFFAAWKGSLPEGKTFDGLVSSLDIAATALAAARIAVKSEDRLESVDLLPYLRGARKEPPHEWLAWRFGRQFAIRKGDWKLACWKDDEGSTFTTALYDLKSDAGETTDQSGRHPTIVRELQAQWDDWNRANVRPLFGDAIEMREVEVAPWNAPSSKQP